MKSHFQAFNSFLLAGLALALLTGCYFTEEGKKKRLYSNIRVHVESDASRDFSSAISVIRSAPVRLNIEREPVVDESDIIGAEVIDQPGGFAIQVKLNRRGTWALERTTVTHRGKHLAVFSHWGPARWLAAPLITGKNSTGLLTFTPDATREEADRIVLGLNNVARKIERKDYFPFLPSMDN
jgi:hypothetical protein